MVATLDTECLSSTVVCILSTLRAGQGQIEGTRAGAKAGGDQDMQYRRGPWAGQDKDGL